MNVRALDLHTAPESTPSPADYGLAGPARAAAAVAARPSARRRPAQPEGCDRPAEPVGARAARKPAAGSRLAAEQPQSSLGPGSLRLSRGRALGREFRLAGSGRPDGVRSQPHAGRAAPRPGDPG